MNTKTLLLLLSVSSIVFGACATQQAGSTIQPTSQPTSTPAPAAKTYTLSDVATHMTEADCWMAINNKVYDATSFVSSHPGGKAILKGCGKDATVLFEQRPDSDKGPHPDAAQKALEKLYIGDLKN